MSEQQVYLIRQTPVSQIARMEPFAAMEFLRMCSPRVRELVKRAWCNA